jgi:hypothetical protein
MPQVSRLPDENNGVPRPRHVTFPSCLRPATARATSIERAARRFANAAVLVLLGMSMAAPRAWDADTMLRSAQSQGPQALAGAKALQLLLTGLTDQDEASKLASS